ncbi:MAG TPA: permease [Firmicutes bacterium]|nr:permease [Bacillota bacterium]
MFNIILYAAAGGSLLYTLYRLYRDGAKTRKSLQVAKKSFFNLLPDLTALFLLVAIVLSVIPPETISKVVGSHSGIWGMLISAVAGSLTLVPGFVAFPLAKSLLSVGAGLTQVIVFISTLMMVGIATAPLEIKYFGKRETLLRNGLAFVYAFIAAILIGRLV